jgi:Protein of unknown function (DUF2842)
VRKLVGSLILLTWMVCYIAVAAVVGDRIAGEHWAWKLLYFPIVGMAWVLPLKPLLRWIHSRDAPHESPDV